jgi:peptide/nickel transport system substrate-binding protein
MRHRLRLLSLAAFAFLFLFTACRNEPKIDNTPKETLVNARLSGDPENLNFILSADANATEIFRLLSVPFASFDPGSYNLTPTLIKQMPEIQEITEGEFKGRIAYDFEILEEAVWDNGSPVTAEDVLFTLKTVFNPHYASPHRSLTAFIKHFEIDPTNPKKFRVYGVKYIIAGAVISNFEAMPKYVYDPDGLLDKFTLAELKDKANAEKLKTDPNLKAFSEKFQSPYHLNNPEGISYAGPYKIESWTTGQELVLVKKKDWWGDQLATKYPLLTAIPSRITYKFVPDINAAVSLAKNGEIDVIGKIPWTKFVELKEDNIIKENFDLHTPQKIAYRFITFNTNDARFEDKKVRYALDHLFNRKQIFETVYYGTSNPTIGPIHTTKPYYNKSLSIRSFDVDKAKNLLTEAGWADSDGNGIVDKVIDGEKVEMEFNIVYGSGFQDYDNLLAIFKDDAIKAGVKINPTTIESQNFFKTLRSRDFDAILQGSEWYPIPPDLYGRYHTKGSQNYGSFSNPELDELITKIRFTVDDSVLPELYLKAQELIHNEMPSIFINTGNDRLIISKKFKDLRVSAVKPHYYLNELTVNKTVPLSVNN